MILYSLLWKYELFVYHSRNWLSYIAMYTELLVCVLTSIIHSYDGYISFPCVHTIHCTITSPLCSEYPGPFGSTIHLLYINTEKRGIVMLFCNRFTMYGLGSFLLNSKQTLCIHVNM